MLRILVSYVQCMKNKKSGHNQGKNKRSRIMKEKKITREDISKMEDAERMKLSLIHI